MIVGIYEARLKEEESIDISELGLKLLDKIGDVLKKNCYVIKIYEEENDAIAEEN